MLCFLSESWGCIIVSGGEVCMHAHPWNEMKLIVVSSPLHVFLIWLASILLRLCVCVFLFIIETGL